MSTILLRAERPGSVTEYTWQKYAVVAAGTAEKLLSEKF